MPDLDSSPYQSYLLRLWEDGDGRRRIMVERITAPPERHYFNSLDDLFLYLERGEKREAPTGDVED